MYKRMMLAGLLVVVVVGIGGVWASDFETGFEAIEKDHLWLNLKSGGGLSWT